MKHLTRERKRWSFAEIEALFIAAEVGFVRKQPPIRFHWAEPGTTVDTAAWIPALGAYRDASNTITRTPQPEPPEQTSIIFDEFPASTQTSVNAMLDASVRVANRTPAASRPSFWEWIHNRTPPRQGDS